MDLIETLVRLIFKNLLLYLGHIILVCISFGKYTSSIEESSKYPIILLIDFIGFIFIIFMVYIIFEIIPL